MERNFRDFFENEDKILFDGAIGTQIYAKGVPKGHCYDELNISMPEIIKTIHREYLEAGAEVLTTNTFGANKYILDKYFDLGKKVKDINYFGARIARTIAKDKAFVAGSVGPISRPLDKEDNPSTDELSSIFREQIEALLEGGVDLLIFETFACLNELIIGIEVAKKLSSDVFVIAEMSFPNNGLTLFGKNPFEVSVKLSDTEADVIGSNCGTGPQNVFEVVRKMGRVTEKPLSAMPNAGLAQFVQGKFYYPYNPHYFANYGKKFLSAGVKVVGGCCGTTPEHIRLLKQQTKDLKVQPRKIKKIEIIEEKEREVKETPHTGLMKVLKKKKALSVEIDPPRDVNYKKILKRLKDYGKYVNTINISDSPMAKTRMSPIALGKILKNELDKEIIVHYTCRDRNILGIQSDLLGASALGLHNILSLGGDPPSIGDYPFATGVYDLTSEGLVEMMSSLNRGTDLLGNPIGEKTHFYIGVGFGINEKISEEILERLRKKIEKGAHFVITQPIYKVEGMVETIEKIKELKVPIMVSIMPLISFKNAEYLHYEVPGITVPEEILKRMEGKSGREGEKEGAKISKELIKELKGIVNGVLIIPPFNRLHLLEDIFG